MRLLRLNWQRHPFIESLLTLIARCFVDAPTNTTCPDHHLQGQTILSRGTSINFGLRKVLLLHALIPCLAAYVLHLFLWHFTLVIHGIWYTHKPYIYAQVICKTPLNQIQWAIHLIYINLLIEQASDCLIGRFSAGSTILSYCMVGLIS